MENLTNKDTINPYAPPKATAGDDGNTTYLDHDGYSFGAELIANQHFKSPLICAKLGIPIDPACDPQLTPTKILRSPIINPRTYNLLIVLNLGFVICIMIAMGRLVSPSLLWFALLAFPVMKYSLTRPYKIPFYFSEQYLEIKKHRISYFTIIFALILISGIYAYFTGNTELVSLCIPAFIITLITFHFKMTKFVITDSKGEFHYIRGVHSNLLDTLPPLPLSTES